MIGVVSILFQLSLLDGELLERVDFEPDELIIKIGIVHIPGTDKVEELPKSLNNEIIHDISPSVKCVAPLFRDTSLAKVCQV